MVILKNEFINIATGDCYMYDGSNVPDCYMDSPRCGGSITD